MGFFEISTLILFLIGVVGHIALKATERDEYKTIGFWESFKGHLKEQPKQVGLSVIFAFVFVVTYIKSKTLLMFLELPGLSLEANVMLSAFFSGYLLDSFSRNIAKLFLNKVNSIGK